MRKLTPEQKYFYLYLMTNENTKQCGIYEIDKGTISHETGYNVETVNKLIKFFQASGKIKYSDKTEEIAIKNWLKYNDSTSPKVKSCINNELKQVKDTVLIQYIYSMDTHSQEEQEEEEEQEREQEEEKEKKVLVFPFVGNDFLNVWDVLKVQPKWKKKSFDALQASLKKLSKYSESDAIQMMEDAIAGGWQGLFEIKRNDNGNSKKTTGFSREGVQDAFNRRLAEIQQNGG